MLRWMLRPIRLVSRENQFAFAGWFLLLGIIAGLGTLVRPETPLVLFAAGVALCVRWWRRANWPKLMLATCWMCAGLLLPLAPWAARNARTFGRVEFLGPRYAQTYGDFIPRGYFAWTGTWMTRFGDSYLVTWKLGKEPIGIGAMCRRSAFDSDAERARVAALLGRYNSELKMTPVLDREFAILAAERTARNPLRTYVVVPAERIAAMWFTPRIELLPYSGKLWPAGEKWRGNPADFGGYFWIWDFELRIFGAGGDWLVAVPRTAGGGIFDFVCGDTDGGDDAVADRGAALRD